VAMCTVRCTRHVQPRQEMPNLEDLSLSTSTGGLPAADGRVCTRKRNGPCGCGPLPVLVFEAWACVTFAGRRICDHGHLSGGPNACRPTRCTTAIAHPHREAVVSQHGWGWLHGLREGGRKGGARMLGGQALTLDTVGASGQHVEHQVQQIGLQKTEFSSSIQHL
jgi:hypothetical protein